MQDVIETVLLPFPCLITVEQDIYTPRLPSMKKRRETKDKAITVFGLEAFLDQNPDNYGLAGSPTQVERIFPPSSDIQQETLDSGDLAKQLHDKLKEWKFL